MGRAPKPKVTIPDIGKETRKRICRQLAHARTVQHLRQLDVAIALGVKQNFISRLESGENITLNTLANFADFVGLKVVLIPKEQKDEPQK